MTVSFLKTHSYYRDVRESLRLLGVTLEEIHCWQRAQTVEGQSFNKGSYQSPLTALGSFRTLETEIREKRRYGGRRNGMRKVKGKIAIGN